MAGVRLISDGDGEETRENGKGEGERAAGQGTGRGRMARRRSRPVSGVKKQFLPELPRAEYFWVKSGLLWGSINQVEGNDAAASHQSALV